MVLKTYLEIEMSLGNKGLLVYHYTGFAKRDEEQNVASILKEGPSERHWKVENKSLFKFP